MSTGFWTADFFIAHADVTLIQRLPKEVLPKASTLGPFHQMVERFRTMPKVAVGIIPGGSGTRRLPRLMGRGRALATESAQQRMARFLEMGGQTPEVELNLEAMIGKLAMES